MATTNQKCEEPDIEAAVSLQLPIDGEGTPIFLHNTPMAHAGEIEFYTCNNCLEQFSQWEQANNHYLGEEK